MRPKGSNAKEETEKDQAKKEESYWSQIDAYRRRGLYSLDPNLPARDPRDQIREKQRILRILLTEALLEGSDQNGNSMPSENRSLPLYRHEPRLAEDGFVDALLVLMPDRFELGSPDLPRATRKPVWLSATWRHVCESVSFCTTRVAITFRARATTAQSSEARCGIPKPCPRANEAVGAWNRLRPFR
jgi:hypothetical protein